MSQWINYREDASDRRRFETQPPTEAERLEYLDRARRREEASSLLAAEAMKPASYKPTEPDRLTYMDRSKRLEEITTARNITIALSKQSRT